MPNFSFNTAFASALLSAAALASDESLSKEKNPFVPYKLRGVHSSTNVDDVGGTPSVPLVLEETEEDIPQVKDLEKGAPHDETLRNVIPDSNISNKVSFVFDPSAELGRLENLLVADHASADSTGEGFSDCVDDEGHPFNIQWWDSYLQYNYYDTSKETAFELEQYKESPKMEGYHSYEALEVHRELGNDRESGARELTICGDYPLITSDSAASFKNLINDCLYNSNCPGDGDIGCWDVSEITDMRFAFGSKNFNPDISLWDTGKVTTMKEMFFGNDKFDQDISSWNTTSVTDMYGVFAYAYAFNHPVERWDVSSVKDMFGVFYKALSFNQPLEDWDVAKVTNMETALRGTPFNQCISSWASKVQDNVLLTNMFLESDKCTAGVTPQADVSPWCQTCPSPTASPTPGPTPSPTPGPTASPTPGPTPSPTPGPTASPTPGPTASPTPGPTPLPTPGPTASPTPGPTQSPTPGPTPSPTPGPTPSPTASPTPGPTQSPTPGPTASPTPGPTQSPTPGPTPSPTSGPTPSPTTSPTPGPTPSPTASPTPGPTPSPTSGPTQSPTPGPTPSPTASPTPGPTPSPTPGPTPSPTPGPTPSPTPGPTPSPTPGPTASPTPGPTPSPTPGPTPSPTPGPTPSPTPGPTPSPTPGPTPSPTPGPTPSPTPGPTPSPTPSPTPGPTPSPTPGPTDSQTENPTSGPTPVPVSCTDNDRKIFEIDLDGEIKTDGDCNWLASENALKRKKYCSMKVEVRSNPSKKLSAICKETCGLVGFGQCAAACEDKSKKFEIVVDVDEGTTKRKNCDWVASKKKSRRREFCNMEVLFKGETKQLPTICKKTCGEFGKGNCTFN